MIKQITTMVKQTTTAPPADNISGVEYCQIVPMTFEERYNMYMRCKKEELAKMLAARDEIDAARTPSPYYVPYPVYPSYPYYNYPIITCSDNNVTIS